MRSLQSIVVTGAAGSVGSALVRQLLDLDEVQSLVALDLLPPTEAGRSLGPFGNDPRLRYQQADINDEAVVARLLRETAATGVINLAEARTGGCELETNILGLAALLRVCRSEGVPLLQGSTDAVYGNVPSPERATEEWSLDPASSHAAGKAAGELLCFAAHREFDQDVFVTRAAISYGPRLPEDHILTDMIRSAVQGAPVILPGDGMQIRDWLHLEDHCLGLIEAFRRARPGEAYNLAGNCERTLLGVTRNVLKILHQPESLIETGGEGGMVAARRATDATLIARYTGWFPRRNFKSHFTTVVREAAANLATAPGSAG